MNGETLRAALPRRRVQSDQVADGANPATGTWYIYATDIQGSIYGVNQGAYQMEFTPYGSLYASTGSVDQFTHRWAQLEWQSPESLYFAPYRWYSPNSIHWLTRDPLGMVDGPNVYAYVMGNPVNAVDPMGLDLIDLIWTGEWNPEPDEWQEAYGSIKHSNIRFYARGSFWHGTASTSYDPISGQVDVTPGLHAKPTRYDRWPGGSIGISGKGPSFLTLQSWPQGLSVAARVGPISYRYTPNNGSLAVGLSTSLKGIGLNVRQDVDFLCPPPAS